MQAYLWLLVYFTRFNTVFDGTTKASSLQQNSLPPPTKNAPGNSLTLVPGDMLLGFITSATVGLCFLFDLLVGLGFST